MSILDASDPRPFWACDDCGAIFRGAPMAAARHFSENNHEYDGHWLWEFVFPDGRMPYVPTGREIHTSDAGGFYLADPPIYTPAEVWERFARRVINDSLRKERT